MPRRLALLALLLLPLTTAGLAAAQSSGAPRVLDVTLDGKLLSCVAKTAYAVDPDGSEGRIVVLGECDSGQHLSVVIGAGGGTQVRFTDGKTAQEWSSRTARVKDFEPGDAAGTEVHASIHGTMSPRLKRNGVAVSVELRLLRGPDHYAP